jgi:hypothetical protein
VFLPWVRFAFLGKAEPPGFQRENAMIFGKTMQSFALRGEEADACLR